LENFAKSTLLGIQFIVISTVVGSGIFINNGEALEISGPAGLIISVVVMSIITIAVGECVGEFTQQFAAPNAIVEYVKTFVDEDLGLVIGLAYWYSMASAFALENLAAASLSQYWGPGQTLQTIAFYVVSPVIILTLNFCGVFVRSSKVQTEKIGTDVAAVLWNCGDVWRILEVRPRSWSFDSLVRYSCQRYVYLAQFLECSDS